jgi:hypothetical protein
MRIAWNSRWWFNDICRASNLVHLFNFESKQFPNVARSGPSPTGVAFVCRETECCVHGT